MKKLITLLVLVLSSAIGFGQPTSHLVTNAKVSYYNDDLGEWEELKTNYPSNMYLVISDMDITVNGEKPLSIRLTKLVDTDYKDGYAIAKYKGYNTANSKKIGVNFYYSPEVKEYTSVVIFIDNKKTALEFNFD